MRRFLITGAMIVILGGISKGLERPTIEQMRQAENELRELVPTLSPLEESFGDDSELLLGLASIYGSYAPSFDYWDRSEDLLRKVLDIDPKNNAARTALIKKVVTGFLSQRGRVLTALEMKRQYAKENKLQQVEIPSWSYLYDWVREEGQEHVVIQDFNEVRARVRSKLDKDLPAVISELDKAEKAEPNNALYNYVRSSLNFALGKEAQGLTEIERGANKPYLNNYWLEIVPARRKVLQAAGFPEHYRKTIENMQTYVRALPSYDRVMKMAKQQGERKNLTAATEVCEVLIRLAEQVRQEPVPGEPGRKRGENEYSKRIEREARRQLSKIRSRGQEDAGP